VLPQDRLYTILKNLDLLEVRNYTTEELKKITSQGQTQYLLQGSFSRSGDTFRIETTLQDIKTGEIINSERVEGAGQTSFFPMIDDLTRRIKLSFNIAPSIIVADIDRDIGEITTSSPEALKYYSENTRGNNLGDHSRSISLLEKAIAVDSDFAI